MCDVEITSVNLDAHKLAALIPALNHMSLPSLSTVDIMGGYNEACMISEHALHGLQAHLKVLALRCGEAVGDTDDAINKVMRVENLGTLLVPWYTTLNRLDLTSCHLLHSHGCRLGDTGFFARLHCLQELRLVEVLATPALDSLDLAGCVALQTLDCLGCNLLSLDLTGCGKLSSLRCIYTNVAALDLSPCHALIQVNCSDNQLTTLQLSGCSHLTSVDCNGNDLTSLDLTASNKLAHLHCYDNKLASIYLALPASVDQLDCTRQRGAMTVVLGGASVAGMSCSVGIYEALSPALCSKLAHLTLEDLISTEFAPPKTLKSLSFREMGPAGSLNLTGCGPLRLACCCARNNNMVITGCGAVCSLSLSGWLMTDLAGFSTLTRLCMHLNQHSPPTLDLSECGTLQRVQLDSFQKGKSPLTSINLTGSFLLEVLICRGSNKLKELDLSAGKRLSQLTCTGSSIHALDLASCPLLKSVDVRNSPLLKTIRTRTHDQAPPIISVGCPVYNKR